MEKVKVFYLCDGTRCFDGPCLNPECKYTLDIEHALHKDDLDCRLFRCMDLRSGDTNGLTFFEEKGEE